MVGLHFDSEEVRDAARGNIVIAYGDDDDSENLVGGVHPADLLEIFYMPVRALDWSVNYGGRILSQPGSQQPIWLIQLVFVVIGILILFVLVRAAHDTINWQQGN